MDFFQHHYYRLIKIFMTLLGQWPSQSFGTKWRIGIGLSLISSTVAVPHVLLFVKYRNDWRIILESFVPLSFGIMCGVRSLGILFNSQKILTLLNRIVKNWQVWAEDREIDVFHGYAKQGETITILYTAALYSIVLLYITQPIILKIIEVALKNDTKLPTFPFPIDYYFFDAQKYYYYVIMHLCITSCVFTIPLVASDTLLIMCVQHVCGIFTALGYKLERIGNRDSFMHKLESPFQREKRNVVDLALLINQHNEAIEYANLIDATYTWIFAFNIGLGLIQVNAIGFQILVRSDDPETILMLIAMVCTSEMVFFMQCYISQTLEDHSTNVGYYIVNSRWYKLPPEIQKLLQLISMRSAVPCQLTVGRMLIMSLRTFGLIFRTAVSYFAVVRNMDNDLNTV